MNFAIILSGGTGSRLKGIDLPKQYYKVCGRTILSYCMESIGRSGDLDAYVKSRHTEKSASFEREDLADGTIVYHVDISGLLQRYTFTEL